MAKKVLVIGAGGQLGHCIQDLVTKDDDVRFLSHSDLDITNKDDAYREIIGYRPDVVINCAAYVNIYEAEKNIVNAYNVNCLGVMYLAQACKTAEAKLIHISTDYVFDGNANIPYKETDICRPLNFYGITKYLGELTSLKENPETIVIRTSWLYSWYGDNFFTKVLSKLDRGERFGVVYDVIGCPTYAMDLADFILKIVRTDKYLDMKGVYNYSNNGAVSRYDFASAIEKLYRGKNEYIYPCLTTSFNDTVKRPMYAVLDKTKTENILDGHIPNWSEALIRCMNQFSIEEKRQ